MNALLYTLVVVIWGTTWIAIFLQQGPVPEAVSIFWRFAIASGTMLTILLCLRRLRPLALRDHLFCMVQGCCVFVPCHVLTPAVYEIVTKQRELQFG